MARQRVADDQITMVQSQKSSNFSTNPFKFDLQQFIKSGLVDWRRFIYSEFLFRASIWNLSLAGVLLPDKIPPRETKWWQICKLKWSLHMILKPGLGFVKILDVCVSSWFQTGPEICLASRTTGQVLHKAIVHIFQVQGCNCSTNRAFVPSIQVWTAPAT